MECIQRLEQVESVIARYNDRLGQVSSNLKQDLIKDSKAERQEITELEKGGRLLKIGIVGRVKAGKSSLINALIFDGKNILPKAATPMTAALTSISYDEKYGVEIDFFTDTDIDNIKKEASKYDAFLKQEIDKLRELPKYKGKTDKQTEEDLLKRAQKNLKDSPIAATKDHYEKIKNSSLKANDLKIAKKEFTSLDEFKAQLSEYVGANGKYMPFTKSVKILLPFESLKDIEIVDTPGVNDPVVSRGERTTKMIGECDVVFVVSPGGQFMSINDLDLIANILTRGVKEVYVIASQIDTQLYGSIKENANGDLHQALEAVKSDLGGQLINTFNTFIQNEPDTKDTLEKLTKRENLILSSGISYNLKQKFSDFNSLDEDENHAYTMLEQNYPDYFSKSNQELTFANLDALSNIPTIEDILKNIAEKKEEILKKSIQSKLEAKTKNINDYIQNLLKECKEMQDEISHTSIGSLLRDQQDLIAIKDEVFGILDDSYEDFIDDFEISLKNELLEILDELCDSTKRNIKTYIREKDGVGSWLARKLWGGGYEEYTTSTLVKRVRTTSVKTGLNDFCDELENAITKTSQKSLQKIKNSLQTKLIRDLGDSKSSNEIHQLINVKELKTRIRKMTHDVLHNISIPNISYSNRTLPSGSGTLEGRDATRFMEETMEFINNIKNTAKNDIDAFVSNISNSFKQIKMGRDLFNQYNQQFEQLRKDITNKPTSLDELSNIIKELEKI